ncbi:acetyl-CoA synthetase-like protein [Aspergillus homomorphus CBS 101889]|uniref:Acetyl-CoA synthetase-like protein n=1 Tax=Aspergillus homomorphus (strain CBS 101889) TaxID=1450537 RepID=A0A395IBH1_ASPHC|nr:acetyl-CoA synthetase-like protein [Aspergillus homomorphus CBS 101889]RAL17315.1 acetyl-CoA synthetase-like protein [Aspergillus homomorphus CBS 101889]
MTELGRHFNLDSETRMLQYTSCSFDPSILEIFGTLIHGGSVCIPTETARLNNIPQAIENLGVNTAVFVPSVLKLLHPDQIPGVTKLIIGGEKLTHSLIDLWAEKKQVINAYGPTETCVCSLANLRVSVRSLGANIGNTAIACRAWVVNPHNERQLMPIGAVGELWIEGPTVARGYLNNAAATEASFVSSLPWANAECGTSTRAYRTGDLVRYLSNGELLFLGRKDKQVKLNGHRVELEEIEAAICRSPLVAHASVQLLSVGGSSVLAAFLVPQGSTRRQQAGDDDICKLLRLSEGDLGAHLRDGLREQLPAYMIPEYMIPVNFIPLMPSGKIDQHRLAEILAQARLLSRKHSSGDNETAKEKAQALPDSYKTMQSLWANALDIPSSTISPTDRFLHLGGNSIRAMKLVSAARDCGIRLTVGEVLKNHTVEEISRIARSKIVRAAAIPKSPVQIDTPRTAYIPTWIQMVSVTTVGAFPEGNYTRIVIDLRGSLDLARLREASRSLVEKNEILRTQYRLRNGTIEAIVLDKTEVDVPVVHFDSRSQAVKHWESVSPDGCLDRQLVEFSYVVMNANSTHFALGLQHSQYDAWTVPLLLSQLQRIYHGLPISSGPPFSVYAARLPLESNAAAEAFWKAQLANLPMTSLRNNGLNDGGDADKPDGHFQRTIRLLPSPFTFATTIYAAWALVLSKHANTKRVVFGGAVSGRNIDMEGILDVVGPCINMIPFTVDVAGVITYLDVLQAVRDALIATVPFEAMPMPDILSRCTDWDPMAAFGSIVQHLDISFDVPPLEGIESGEVGGPGMLKWKYLEVRKQYGRCRATDIYVCSSTATGDAGAADVQLKFNPSVISPELAGALFDELCGHISAALQSPAQDIRK